jgi:hypothetical protein
LEALNQPFRGFLCYQGLEADFVSLRSREAPGEACLSASGLARRVETAEPVFHLVDLAADSPEGGPSGAAVGRKARIDSRP